MTQDWESTFAGWAKPPSETEKEKSENAERMGRKAVQESSTLSARGIRVFPQGSYRNSTNVRQDSDVDIGVCCVDLVHPDYTFVPGVGDSSAVALLPDTRTAR